MINLNWKLRFKNKAVLSALIASIITFVYQILGILNVVPAISEAQVVEFTGVILNILWTLGIIIDPTTKGINDSELALTYDECSDVSYLSEVYDSDRRDEEDITDEDK